MPLQMVVATHSPESCGLRDDHRGMFTDARKKLGELASERSSKVEGSWEAPSAHGVDQLYADSGWVTLSESRVYSVTTTQPTN